MLLAGLHGCKSSGELLDVYSSSACDVCNFPVQHGLQGCGTAKCNQEKTDANAMTPAVADSTDAVYNAFFAPIVKIAM